MLRTLSINDYSTQTSHQPKGEEERRERREVDQVMDLNYINILLRVQANKSKISCYHN